MTIDEKTAGALLELLNDEETLEILSMYHTTDTIDAILDLIAALKQRQSE